MPRKITVHARTVIGEMDATESTAAMAEILVREIRKWDASPGIFADESMRQIESHFHSRITALFAMLGLTDEEKSR